MKDMSAEFRKLVLGKGGSGKKKTVRKRVKRGNWSVFGIGEMKTDNPRLKGKGGTCGMCGKKIGKNSFLCARCNKYDKAHTKYMHGEINKMPKW